MPLLRNVTQASGGYSRLVSTAEHSMQEDAMVMSKRLGRRMGSIAESIGLSELRPSTCTTSNLEELWSKESNRDVRSKGGSDESLKNVR